MSEIITIGISDMKIGTAPDTLVTFALGSCIGICLYEPVLKIGALGHIMLPNSPDLKNEKSVNKYADTCIPHMLERLQFLQCQKARLTAKIVGGAKMFEMSGDTSFGNIGQRNIEAVKKVLQEYKIPIYAEDTGLNYGRTVYFHLDTGAVEVKSFNRETKIL